MRRVLVDTGALIALVRERDAYHARALRFFDEFRSGELLTTAAVLTETLHLLPAHLGAPVLALLRPPRWRLLDLAAGLPRIAELLTEYADRPMDFADASLFWAAEQSGALEILSTDQDFAIYRTRGREKFVQIL